MPAGAIVESLPYVNWLVLSGLAAGSLAAVAVLRVRAEGTRGFLAFTAFCAALLAGIALLADLALPVPDPALAIVAAPSLDAVRRALLAALAILALAETAAIWTRRSAPLAALAGTAAGAGALIAGAAGWSGFRAEGVPVALQFLFLAAATGGVLAAMILGHWYLVTPKLPERPLVLLARLLFAVVALQALLGATWLFTGANAGLAPLAPLGGPWAFFVWMRLLVGIGLPLAISWMAVRTARSRSMESATGLLYIDVGLIAAGTILAAGLAFGPGLLV